jgi:hypothetical protein
MLYHSSHTTSPFCFSYFGDRVLHLYPGWPLLTLPNMLEMTGMGYHVPLLLVEMGSWELFVWASLMASNHNPSDLYLSSSWDYRCGYHAQLCNPALYTPYLYIYWFTTFDISSSVPLSLSNQDFHSESNEFSELILPFLYDIQSAWTSYVCFIQVCGTHTTCQEFSHALSTLIFK